MTSDTGCWLTGTFYLSILTAGQNVYSFILTLKTIHWIDIFTKQRNKMLQVPRYVSFIGSSTEIMKDV